MVFVQLQVLIEEEIEWMAPSDSGVPALEEMLSWKMIGPVSSCLFANLCFGTFWPSGDLFIYLSILVIFHLF